MAIVVRQRQFAFGTSQEGTADLVTGNVWTCMGLVAIHRPSGLVFLAHLDTPWYCHHISKPLQELKKRVPNLDELELYDVAGVHPVLPVFASAAALLLSLYWTSWEMLLLSFLMLGLACGTRIWTRIMMWKLGFKQPRLLTGLDVNQRDWSRLCCRLIARVGPVDASEFALTLTRQTESVLESPFAVVTGHGTFRSALQRGFFSAVKWIFNVGTLERAKGSS